MNEENQSQTSTTNKDQQNTILDNNHQITKINRQADVLDQTRLRPQVAHSAEDTSQMSLFCFSKDGI